MFTEPLCTSTQECVLGAVTKQPCNGMDAAFFAANGIAANTQAACENIDCCWHVHQAGGGVCHEPAYTTPAPTPQPGQTPNHSACADGSQNCHVQTPQTAHAAQLPQAAQTPQAPQTHNDGPGGYPIGLGPQNTDCDGTQNCHVQTPKP